MRQASPFVLIVDDDDDNRDLHTTYLPSCGFKVVTATNGQQGIEMATTVQPDLIVLDLAMPQIGGVEVCRRLKANPRTRKSPVIALTVLDRRRCA